VKRKPRAYSASLDDDRVLNEALVSDQPPLIINVRSAKDQLSSLLDAAARGDEVVITSDGRPKAKLVPFQSKRPLFRMHWSWLRAQPIATGAPSEDLIREDRDSRD
jgi:prevent-host-death family protein